MAMIMLPTTSAIEDLDNSTSVKVAHLYRISIATHATSAFFQILFSWRKLLNFKILQVIDTGLIFLNIYLMLVAVETFSFLMDIGVSEGDIFNFNKNNLDTTGKSFFLSLRQFLTHFCVLAIDDKFTDADQ